MQTYKFQTTISDTGTISLPINNLANGMQVEVIIKPIINKNEFQINTDKSFLVDSFIEEWSGILKDTDFEAIDDNNDPRFQHLKEKYLCNR